MVAVRVVAAVQDRNQIKIRILCRKGWNELFRQRTFQEAGQEDNKMKIFNTMSRQKEEFVPIEEERSACMCAAPPYII